MWPSNIFIFCCVKGGLTFGLMSPVKSHHRVLDGGVCGFLCGVLCGCVILLCRIVYRKGTKDERNDERRMKENRRISEGLGVRTWVFVSIRTIAIREIAHATSEHGNARPPHRWPPRPAAHPFSDFEHSTPPLVRSSMALRRAPGLLEERNTCVFFGGGITSGKVEF